MTNIVVNFLGILIGALRSVVLTNRVLLGIIFSRQMQGMQSHVSKILAYRVYLKAKKNCPAYNEFAKQNQIQEVKYSNFLDITETSKENYVKKFSIEDRCYFGKIPTKGVVIDESSGSSGEPNNWVRGAHDRADIKKLLQLSYGLTYEGRHTFLLNCFALGPWATGMNVSMSLADTTITKSIGPDISKLENTLKKFGSNYEYVIVGYPPFIKLFVNNTKLELRNYKIHFITGGEPISEGLHKYLSNFCLSMISSYGASDLDINIGAETGFSLKLRKICGQNPRLTKELFGREQVPMIFQYNPIDYYIENSRNGELVFTVNRIKSASPKIRYNLHDIGGTISYKKLVEVFSGHGLSDILPRTALYLPILYTYGRGDLCVSFYGSKVFSTDLDSILHETSELAECFNTFQLSTFEDDKLEKHLKISFELNPTKEVGAVSSIRGVKLNEFISSELRRVNQDFREVSKMFSDDKVIVETYSYGTGPFKDRDIRVKQKYIKPENSES